MDSEWPDSVSRDNVRAESSMAEFFMAFSAKDYEAIQASGTVDPTEVFPGSQLVYLKNACISDDCHSGPLEVLVGGRVVRSTGGDERHVLVRSHHGTPPDEQKGTRWPL